MKRSNENSVIVEILSFYDPPTAAVLILKTINWSCFLGKMKVVVTVKGLL